MVETLQIRTHQYVPTLVCMLPTSRNERNMNAVKIEQRYLKISSTSFGYQANLTRWFLNNAYFIALEHQEKKKA